MSVYPIRINAETFNIYLQKLSECTATQKLLSFGDFKSPDVKIKSLNNTQNCVTELTGKLYAFTSNLFDCSKT